MVRATMTPPRNDARKRPLAQNANADRSTTTAHNVGDTERMISAIGGGALAVIGLSSRDTLAKVLLPLIGAGLVYRGVSGQCSMYRALGISSRSGPAATAVPSARGVRVEHSIVINKPADELFRYWRRFDRLPTFMDHLEKVDVIDDKRSRWTAKAPLGMQVSWDAEVIQETPGEMIAWRSLPGSTVATAGSVHFEPSAGMRSTTVRVNLKYNPPGGRIGAVVARWFGESPEVQVREDLEHFKQLMETGNATRAPSARVERL